MLDREGRKAGTAPRYTRSKAAAQMMGGRQVLAVAFGLMAPRSSMRAPD
jgi:hypothetical protein